MKTLRTSRFMRGSSQSPHVEVSHLSLGSNSTYKLVIAWIALLRGLYVA